MAGYSTTCQQLHTYHAFCEAAVDNGKEVKAVFYNISAKPSTGSGTRDYSINLLAISQVVDNGWSLMVYSQSGSNF